MSPEFISRYSRVDILTTLLKMYLVCFLSASFLLDIDECSVNKGGCQHNCVNTPGSLVCKCDDGYYLDADKKSCQGKDASTLFVSSFFFLPFFNLKVWQHESHVLRLPKP